jgi:hypothetical protein
MTRDWYAGAIAALEELPRLAGWLNVVGASKEETRALRLAHYRAQLAKLDATQPTPADRSAV